MATKKTKKKKPAQVTQTIIQEAPPEVNLKVVDTENALSDEDFNALAWMCQKGRNAYELKVYNYDLLKFAVYYKEKWYFVDYNRHTHKVISANITSPMSEEERKRFMRFKSITETKMRRLRLGLDKPPVKPTVVVATRKRNSIASANQDF
jgi:hypothetical protein